MKIDADLWAFWGYDLFPYCLSGKVSSMQGELVYIASYQGWFKPIKLVAGREGEELARQIKLLGERYEEAQRNIKKDFRGQLSSLIPEAL